MNRVWHIYHATRGIAGAYVDALLNASKTAGVDARAFVSCNYRYRNGKINKFFFPITDFSEKRNRLIILLRGFELAAAYICIFALAIFARPVIVLHLIDDLYVTYLLFKGLKALELDVKITCHDVSSHYLGMNRRRKEMLTLADELIVHSDAARRKLKEHFGEDVTNKIRSYPFPSSAYDEIISNEKLVAAENRLREQIGSGYYLFLGVVRSSKGIDTMVNAWKSFNKDKNEKLVIAGRWTDPVDNTRRQAENDNSIVIMDRYLDDEEFVQLMKDAKFVVLPYLDYAHSAVIVSCGNHNGAVVISDIELFTEYLPNYKLTFKNSKAEELVRVLNQTADMATEEINSYRTILKRSIDEHNEDLVSELKKAYGANN